MEQVLARFQTMEQEVIRAQQMAAAAEARAAAAEAKGQLSDQVMQQLSLLPNAVAQAVATGSQSRSSQRQLIDPKGLGKPPSFRGNEADFQMWVRKTGNYILSVFPEGQELMREAAESAIVFHVQAYYGAQGMPPNQVCDEIDNQVYAALMALTTDEPFDITVGAGIGKGLEAWRRLHRRYDPATVGRSRGLLREILTPEKSNITNLRHSVEKLEERIRRYTERRDVNGQKLTLNEDIRMAALEAMLPDELEKHIQLNRGRLNDYNALRNEVMLYAEARGTSSAPPKPTPTPHHPDDMDTSALDKGKGKNKQGGKGKGSDSVCWTCGKKGHTSTSCWHAAGAKTPATHPTPTSTATGKNPNIECWKCGKKGHVGKECRSSGKGKDQPKGKGKGKSKGKSKHANALDQQEPETENPEEAWGFEMASLSQFVPLNQFNEIDASPSEWLKLNVDSGAAKTVFPEDANYGTRVEQQKLLSFRTATGEIVPSSGDLMVTSSGENGETLKFKGSLAPVRKPLVSAGDITNKGNDMYYFEDEAYIIAKGTRLQQIMRKAFSDAMRDEKNYNEAITMYKENNIYNMYVKVGLSSAGSPVSPPFSADRLSSAGSPVSSREICPADSPEQGFHRQGRRP